MSAPDTAVFSEPSFRAFQPWNPQLLLGAELLCDGGTMRAAADLCEQMLADDRLLAVINKRVHGVLGLDVTFEPARGRKSPCKALEADEDWWAMFGEAELGEVLKWGFLLGIGIGELCWVQRGKRIVGVLKAWHPRHLTWDWNLRCWKLRVEGQQDIVITPGDGKWMLFTPYGAKRPWAKGLWRSLSRWWLLKQYAIFDWGKYSERHGQGTWVGVPLQGASPGLPDRKQLAADLQAMARAANVVMPPGYDLKLVEATANNWQTFKAQSDAANTAFAITLLGNNLSTEVTGGSFAAADVHKVVESTVLRFTAETAATFTHDQALTWWALFNFGSADVAPWPHWATDPPEDLQAKATLLVAFSTALLAFAKFKTPLPIDLEALCTKFQIPLQEGVEVPQFLTLPDPPPSPFGAPPGGGGEDDDELADDESDDDETKKAKAVIRAVRAKAASRAGARNGRAYADAVAKKAKARANAVLAPDVKSVLEAIGEADSFEDLRKGLLKRFPAMNPKALAKILHDAALMSAMAGRAAVKQDAT